MSEEGKFIKGRWNSVCSSPDFHLLEICPNLGYGLMPFSPIIKFDGKPLYAVQSVVIEAGEGQWTMVTLKLACNVEASIPIEVNDE